MKDQILLCIPSELLGFRCSRWTALPHHWVYICVIMINMVHKTSEIKTSDCCLIYGRRRQEMLSQDPLLIQNKGNCSTWHLLFLWKALWVITGEKKKGKKEISAEQQLDPVFMLVAELGLLFQILQGYILISSNSEFQRSSAQPWPISLTQGLSLEVLLGEFKNTPNKTKPLKPCIAKITFNVTRDKCYFCGVLTKSHSGVERALQRYLKIFLWGDLLVTFFLHKQSLIAKNHPFFIVAVDFKG